MSSPRLSRETLSKALPGVRFPAYDLGAVRPGIVHFGLGNFHRAHQCVYIDNCLGYPDQNDWGIVGVSLGVGADSLERINSLREQDCLFTVAECDPTGSVSLRVIGALIDCLHAPTQSERVLAQLVDPATRIVSLTITEGGYNFDPETGRFDLDSDSIRHDLIHPATPRSVYGYLVEALARRRSLGLRPFTIASCDNLRGNGQVARAGVTAFAGARDPELGAWIESEVRFPSSMVDRIVPRTSAEIRVDVTRRLGLVDSAPVLCESFSEWVLEDEFGAGRPLLEATGVEFRSDVGKFELMKGRLLNGAHVMLCYPGLVAGQSLVDEAVRVDGLRILIDRFMRVDVIPRLEGPSGRNLQDYASTVLARFSNPATRDQLLRIAHDGAAKVPTFLAPTFAGLLADDQAELGRMAASITCFDRYLRGVGEGGRPIEPFEPNLTDNDRRTLALEDEMSVLRISPLKQLRLWEHERFMASYAKVCNSIEQVGLLRTLETL